MNYVKFGLRFLAFSALLTLTTVLLKLFITKMYSLLLEYHSLPESDSNITVLAFVISLVFTLVLSFSTGYWKVSKA